MYHLKALLCSIFMFSFVLFSGDNVTINQAWASDQAVEKKGGLLGLSVDETSYVSLNPIIVPILGDDGEAQLVTIMVSLEVPNSEAQSKVQEQKLRLVDAFITDMYGVLDNNHLLRNGYIDVARMKQRLSKISDKVLGEHIVTSVLVKGVQQRRV